MPTVTVNVPPVRVVPPVVTFTGPVDEFEGTVATKLVGVTDVAGVAGEPVNVTVAGDVNPVPVKVTIVCSGPDVGEKPVSVGAVAVTAGAAVARRLVGVSLVSDGVDAEVLVSGAGADVLVSGTGAVVGTEPFGAALALAGLRTSIRSFVMSGLACRREIVRVTVYQPALVKT